MSPAEEEVENKNDFPAEHFLLQPDPPLPSSLGTPSIKWLWMVDTRAQTWSEKSPTQ